MLNRWGRLYHVSYVLIKKKNKGNFMLTRWVTLEVDVEGDTAEFGRTLICALDDIVIIHGVEPHISESSWRLVL
jgi:hypothetical protein